MDNKKIENERLRCRVYYANNKESLKIKRKGKAGEYYQKNKDKVNNKMREKRKNSEEAANLHRLRSALNKYVSGKSRKGKYLEVFGVSNWEQLRKHFEKKFTHEMNWLNYGGKHGWQIDHVLPCSSFDLSKESEILKCFNVKNLRPVWAHENRENYYTFNQIKVKEFDHYIPVLFEVSINCPHCRKKVGFQFSDTKERQFNKNEIVYFNCPLCKELFGLSLKTY